MAHAGSTSLQPSFTVNGRFYGQRVTGVQRYAREIVLALDALVGQSGLRSEILLPGAVEGPTDLRSIQVVPARGLRGHVWEQIALPARCTGPLLNLCNTAPAALVRQIVCIHDANVFEQPDSYSLPFRLAYQALLPWLARRAGRITTVSRMSAQHLAAHLPIAAARIDVLPNGHEHVFRWSAAASSLHAQLATARPYVLLLGSQARHKNLGLVLNQAERLDELGLDLMVAGGGGRIFTDVPQARHRNVRHLGVVSDDDLAALYGHALCLAFPSWTEGFGLPIVEAMALGCPVVSSDRASMPEICGEAALLAAPDDPTRWHAHVAALARSPSLGDELRARGREQVRRFSWIESARGYLSLIGSIA